MPSRLTLRHSDGNFLLRPGSLQAEVRAIQPASAAWLPICFEVAHSMNSHPAVLFFEPEAIPQHHAVLPQTDWVLGDAGIAAYPIFPTTLDFSGFSKPPTNPCAS